MKIKKSRSKFLQRIEKIQHALWHLAHGVFPSIGYIEKKVTHPDFDHIPATGKFKSRHYVEHFAMNYKCAVRHLVEAIFSFLEVKIK